MAEHTSISVGVSMSMAWKSFVGLFMLGSVGGGIAADTVFQAGPLLSVDCPSIEASRTLRVGSVRWHFQ